MQRRRSLVLATMLAVVVEACGAGTGGAASPADRASGQPAVTQPAVTERPVTEPPVAGSPSAPPTASQAATPSLAPSPSPAVPARPPAATATPVPSAKASVRPPARAGCLKNEQRDVFMEEILGAIRQRDRRAVSRTMARTFQYMVEATDVGLEPVSAAAAARQLFAGVPDPDGHTWFVPVGHPKRVRCADSYRPRDLGASRGFWPTQWDVAVEVKGLGADGDATGWLMLGTNAAGQPVWRGLLFGFPGIDLFE